VGLSSPGQEAVIEELPQGLFAGLLAGRPEARAEFFRRYASQAQRILYLQGFCDEVDDAVQEVFIKVFRARLPAEERFLAWFYQVILNVGRDQGRRRRTKQGLLERLEQISPDSTVDAPAAPADPALRRALAALSDEFRECVALRFYADLSLEGIAKVQQIPVGTVKSRLHAAMAKLRESLLAEGFVNDG
jgi:RNA polymerase sigma-70 factor (ECF subfamily)